MAVQVYRVFINNSAALVRSENTIYISPLLATLSYTFVTLFVRTDSFNHVRFIKRTQIHGMLRHYTFHPFAHLKFHNAITLQNSRANACKTGVKFH